MIRTLRTNLILRIGFIREARLPVSLAEVRPILGRKRSAGVAESSRSSALEGLHVICAIIWWHILR
jgi:hypothetical protein